MEDKKCKDCKNRARFGKCKALGYFVPRKKTLRNFNPAADCQSFTRR